jgi:hypothetical protein
MNKQDHELLLELGFTLIEYSIEELYWLYSISIDGTDLMLSWSLTEGSMQTAVRQEGVFICKVCSEGLTFSQATHEGIEARFSFEDSATTLRIRIEPRIQVEWDTLRT